MSEEDRRAQAGGKGYETHSEGDTTGKATSALLPGFEVDAAAIWAAAPS